MLGCMVWEYSEYDHFKLLAYCGLVMPCATIELGDWINIKMSSYQYRKPHCGDKMILRPSYLHNGISYTGKMASLYWIRTLVVIGSGNGLLPVIANRTTRNNIWWILNWNTKLFIWENASENAAWKMSAILFMPQYVNTGIILGMGSANERWCCSISHRADTQNEPMLTPIYMTIWPQWVNTCLQHKWNVTYKS